MKNLKKKSRVQFYWFLGKKECKELSFGMFLTQAASCDFGRDFCFWENQQFLLMLIYTKYILKRKYLRLQKRNS